MDPENPNCCSRCRLSPKVDKVIIVGYVLIALGLWIIVDALVIPNPGCFEVQFGLEVTYGVLLAIEIFHVLMVVRTFKGWANPFHFSTSKLLQAILCLVNFFRRPFQPSFPY
jgi:hypothetical protein